MLSATHENDKELIEESEQEYEFQTKNLTQTSSYEIQNSELACVKLLTFIIEKTKNEPWGTSTETKQVKFISQTIKSNKQFSKEVQILKKAKKANIETFVKKIDHRTNTIIMEYLENGSLFQFIEKYFKVIRIFTQQVREEFLRRLFLLIIEQLEKLHLSKIAHLDITLQNVLFDTNLMPKFIDFGHSEQCLQDNLTIYSKIGTESYASPQIMEESDLTKDINPFKSDIWSLGVTLYALCYFDLDLKFPKVQQSSLNLQSLLKAMTNINPELRPSLIQIKNSPFLMGPTMNLKDYRIIMQKILQKQ